MLIKNLEFYTRAQVHITIVLVLRAQHRTLLSIFLKKQYFFLIPILSVINNALSKVINMEFHILKIVSISILQLFQFDFGSIPMFLLINDLKTNVTHIFI